MLCYCLHLHNLKYIQSNKILNSKQHIQIYIYLCDNMLKFKKNEEVGVIEY